MEVMVPCVNFVKKYLISNYKLIMKIAILVAGSINTMVQLHQSNNITINKIIKELETQKYIEYDTFVCTSNYSAFKNFPPTAINNDKTKIYGQTIIKTINENSYKYTIGYLSDNEIKTQINTIYNNVQNITIIDDDKIQDNVIIPENLNRNDTLKKFNHMYWFSYKIKQAYHDCWNYELTNNIKYDAYIYVRPDSFILKNLPIATQKIISALTKISEIKNEPYIITRIFGSTIKNTDIGAISQKCWICTKPGITLMVNFFYDLHNLTQNVYQCKTCAETLFENDNEHYSDKNVNICYKCNKETYLNKVSDGLSEYKLYQHIHKNNILFDNIGLKFDNLR